jgi:excisionase family DNA binding protein
MPNTTPGAKLLTTDEAAEALSLRPKTIRAWVAARRLGCVRLGRAVRIPRAEVDRVIGQGTVPAREVL